MKPSLVALFALTGLAFAQSGEKDDETNNSLISGDLLRDGAVLRDVKIPSFDSNLQIRSMLRAEKMIYTAKELKGEIVSIDFYNPGEKPGGTVKLATALFDTEQQILTSQEPFVMTSDQLDATGRAIIYSAKAQQGYIRGPVTAAASIKKKETAMNTRATPAALTASVALAMSAALPAPAAPSAKEPTPQEMVQAARLTAAQLEEIAEKSKTAAPAANDLRSDISNTLAEAKKEAEDSSAALTAFATGAALQFMTAAAPATEAGPDQVPIPPELLADAENKTRITADDGAYINREKGLIVFLKNVKVTDPEMGTITGADELKVIFKPEPPKEEAKKDGEEGKAPTGGKATEGGEPQKEADAKDNNPFSGSGGMGELEKIIATGTAIQITGKDPKAKKPGQEMHAAGRSLIYDAKNREIILKGGSPWLMSEGNNFRVVGEDAYIRYSLDTGESVTSPNGKIELLYHSQNVKDKNKKEPKKEATKTQKTAPR